MIIVASLNLPYSPVFAGQEAVEAPRTVLNTAQSLLRPEEDADPAPDVPFDAAENDKVEALPTETPLELAPIRSREHSFLSSLAKVDLGDEDVRLELQRLNKQFPPSSKSDDAKSETQLRFFETPFAIAHSSAANQGLFNALNSAVIHGSMSAYKSVGLLGMDIDEFPDSLLDDIRQKLVPYRCYPAYVPDRVKSGHYDVYSKEFLWPTFHCQIPDFPKSKAYEEHSWGDYVAVNQAVADAVVQAYRPGDIVWVHDYHLMLVPEMVRRKLPAAPIGFFMHVAFPSSEVFRCLAFRAEILRGMLAANSVAFHVPEYVHHFKMSVARVLAVDITAPGVIEEAEHDTFVTNAPLGIDTERLDKILDSDNFESAVQQHRRVIRRRWPHQRIIAARDKLDPIRGLVPKLRAFELFLEENPHWVNEVVLIQMCSQSRGQDAETIMETMADQINSRHGDLSRGVLPVVLLKQDVKYEQFLALLCEADGFCVSCLRDGMNLTCHEYAYCNSRERMGPLILSEFTGSASVLRPHALLINPWDRKQLAAAFKKCVEMPRWERQERWEGLRRTVMAHPACLWAEELSEQISEAWEDERSRDCLKPDIDTIEKLYHDVGDDEKRVFFLELELPVTDRSENLRNQEIGPKPVRTYERRRSQLEGGRPPQAFYYASRAPVDINELCHDPRNIVYVLSAESRRTLEWMFRSAPHAGLIAEFGRFVKRHDESQWTELPLDDNHWKQSIQPWVQLLKDRTVVSEITIHDTSIQVVFVDSSNDPQRDLSVLGEYVSLLNDHYARQLGIRTKLEKNVLTVYRSNLGVQRRNAFQYVMHDLRNVGLTFVAMQPFATEADDVVYQWCTSLQKSGLTRELVTLVVGKHQSHAQAMLEGTNALLNLLHTIRTKDEMRLR